MYNLAPFPEQNGILLSRSASRIYHTEAERWLAIQNRASDANSDFFYGVTTTRIYCRPTCLGRVARRANVVYFDNILLAQASGYRACKRCKPHDWNWSRDSSSLETVRLGQSLIIQSTFRNKDWTVEDIATQLGVCAPHFHRLFKRFSGTTPKEFARRLNSTEGYRTIPVFHFPAALYDHTLYRPINVRNVDLSGTIRDATMEVPAMDYNRPPCIRGESLSTTDTFLRPSVGLGLQEDLVNWEDWVSRESEDGSSGEMEVYLAHLH